MLRRKKLVDVPDDTGQARAARSAALAQLRRLHEQKAEVCSLKERLERRREWNHFGEEISVSFRPRQNS
ncbi:DUF7620 family protein [Leucobacter japonicus]|uniref:DUF7620 family protein n=1 Tax=Leucobacter japonicus TaxID=1461259 RepID=UPI003F9BFD3A